MLAKAKRCRLPNGLEVVYSSKTFLDILWREIFEENLYDRHGITLCDGDCVFDAGANIGFFVLYLNQVLKHGTVFAFEPIPETFELLKRNVERNNHLDARIFDCGLSDKPGTATFTYFPRTDVGSTMCPDRSPEFRRNSRKFVLEEMKNRGGLLKLAVLCTPSFLWWPVTELVRQYYHKTVQVTIPLRTISDIIDEYDVPQIDLLKVDVEGAEEHVLAGVRAEHWPRVRQVVVEIHRGDEGVARIDELLNRWGFATALERPFPNVEHLYLVYGTRQAEGS